ncbi:type IV secretory system conjugative DNA transfer family protein [Carnobacterium maltaromaticum]|uniref:VirD4-like conjugal transfer protein, CD1115 family n=1 Tax=Lactobacillales TaxID=186826 RepID=UPI00298A733B|nr:type IV secretory system conjugative DNA transfer family protein [Carnobacterium maltaromaticum]MDW5525213.1 type IV secretory system conjugative DNA transfer family protein [Carnobacterium maltaromaticum]
MNKEYKQYKKIFANPAVIAGFLLFVYGLAIPILNFLIHFISRFLNYLQEVIQSFKNLGSIVDIPNPLNEIRFEWFFSFYKELWFLYIVGLILVSFWAIPFAYRMRIAFKDINKNTKGTARFTTMREMRKQYKKVYDGIEEYEGKSGFPVMHAYEFKRVPIRSLKDIVLNIYYVLTWQRVGFVFIDTNDTNTTLLASTQSGKTELGSYPQIDIISRAKIKDTMIIPDLKGDLLKNTKLDLEKYGYLVLAINLIQPEYGIGYNPLELIKQAYIKRDFDRAQNLCNTFSYSLFHNAEAKDPMWQQASMALLNALILAVCDICYKSNTLDSITMYTVNTMLIELGSNPDEHGYTRLDYYFEGLPATNPARQQYATIQFSQGVTRGGILTGTMASLKSYMYTNIAKLTAKNELDIKGLAYGDKPVAFFIVYPDYDSSNFALVSTLLSQIDYVLSEEATLSPSSKLPRRVLKLLEELGNFPAISGLRSNLNVGLSRGMRSILVLQSKAQLATPYGEKEAEAIFSACGNQILLMTDEMADANDFSDKLGEKTIVTMDRHGDPTSMDKSYGEHEDGRNLLLASELRRLKVGEWIVIRTKKRTDLKGRRIEPFPIITSNKKKTVMLHRYEYLMDRYDNPQTFDQLNMGGKHTEVVLENLVIDFSNESEEIPDQIAQYAEEFVTNKSETLKEQGSQISNAPVHENVESSIENVLEDFYREVGEEEIMEQMEKISETHTPYKEKISKDKYKFLCNLIKDKVSETEYEYFLSLKSIEEIRIFFEAKNRATLLVRIKHIIYT